MSRCRRLREPPESRKSAASQSRSSGWLGRPPILPTALGGAFEGCPRVAGGGGEPVEELGVAGAAAHFAEVVGGVDDSAAEVVVPDAVDDGAPGEGVVGVGDP